MRQIKVPELYLEILEKEKKEIDTIINYYKDGLITCPEFIKLIKTAGTKYQNIKKIINK